MTEFLSDSQLFADSSDTLRVALAKLAKRISIKQGEDLFRQGDLGGDLFVIEEGLIEISLISEDGRKLRLNTLENGHVFGEIALLDEGSRTATATALRDTRLLKVERSELVASIRKLPDLGIEIMALAGRRLRWINAQLEERTFELLPVRLARRLCLLDDQASMNGENWITIAQEDLADYTGATRVAVANVLGEWKRKQIVRPARGRITICDRARLSQIALGEKNQLKV